MNGSFKLYISMILKQAYLSNFGSCCTGYKLPYFEIVIFKLSRNQFVRNIMSYVIEFCNTNLIWR